MNLTSGVKKCKVFAQTRYVFTFWCASGLFMIFALRSNLSVTIVAMVKHPPVTTTLDKTSDIGRCPKPVSSDNSSQTIEEDGPFSWNLYQQGLLHGAFFYGAAVSHIPGAWLAQVAGGKWVFGGGMIILSTLTFLVPAASYAGFGLVVTIRAVQGLAEGVCYPAMYNMMARWAPKNERTILLGITTVGSMLGNIFVYPLSTYLCKHGFSGGWPSVFYVTGMMGVVWCFFWSFMGFNCPEEHSRISQEERLYIENTRDISKRSFQNVRIFLAFFDGIVVGGGCCSFTQFNFHRRKISRIPWKSIFTSKAIWALIAVRFGAGWGYFTILTELPTYLKTVHHFKLKSNGALNSAVYVCQIAGTLAGSFASDLLRARTALSINVIRKGFVVFAFMSAGILLCFVTLAGCDVTAIIVLLLTSMVCYGTVSGGELSTFVDLAPQYAGMVYGICSVFTSISGFVTPQIAGAIVNQNATISQWGVVFYVCLGIYVACALIFLVFGSSKAQTWADGEENVSTDVNTTLNYLTQPDIVLTEYLTFQQVRHSEINKDT